MVLSSYSQHGLGKSESCGPSRGPTAPVLTWNPSRVGSKVFQEGA